MLRSGSTNFTDVGDYQASVRGAEFNLVFNCQKDFKARLTWIELCHLRLLSIQENLPRVARICWGQARSLFRSRHVTARPKYGMGWNYNWAISCSTAVASACIS